jgi:hypothetical protein
MGPRRYTVEKANWNFFDSEISTSSNGEYPLWQGKIISTAHNGLFDAQCGKKCIRY